MFRNFILLCIFFFYCYISLVGQVEVFLYPIIKLQACLFECMIQSCSYERCIFIGALWKKCFKETLSVSKGIECLAEIYFCLVIYGGVLICITT